MRKEECIKIIEPIYERFFETDKVEYLEEGVTAFLDDQRDIPAWKNSNTEGYLDYVDLIKEMIIALEEIKANKTIETYDIMYDNAIKKLKSLNSDVQQ